MMAIYIVHLTAMVPVNRFFEVDAKSEEEACAKAIAEAVGTDSREWDHDAGELFTSDLHVSDVEGGI